VRPRFPSLCYLCEHFVPGIDPTNDRDRPVCKAFPESIPSKILDGGFDHRQPLGNESVTFKLSAEFSQTDVEEWEQDVLDIMKTEMLGVLRQIHGESPW